MFINIIVIEVLRFLIKDKNHIRQKEGKQRACRLDFFQKLEICSSGRLDPYAPVDQTFEKFEKKGCRFKRKCGVFMPPFPSFID